MSWDFETDADFQERLDWVNTFVREEIEPLDIILGSQYDKDNVQIMSIVRPLQDEVKRRELWGAHLGPELGGQGFGQVKLALLNEILGRSRFAPTVFGCQAPDSGNAEVLARFGTDELKQRFLEPLLAGGISSCYSMTEPHAGADPTLFTTRARRDGDEWVISGDKWFSSNARYAKFFVVMAVTNPEVSAHSGMSMFIVPADTPGLEIMRSVGVGTEPEERGSHGYVRYNDVRVPSDYLLGEEGTGFAVAQIRLGGGRIHHAMRSIGVIRQAFDMMTERALSRQVRTGSLASLGVVQDQIADSWIEIEQFRLLVLRTAWLVDKYQDYERVRKDIAAVKALMPKVFHDVVRRAMHLHGALGISNEMPFAAMMVQSEIMAIADGPTEVHKATVARQVLKEQTPTAGLWPSMHLPTRREAALQKFAGLLEATVAND